MNMNFEDENEEYDEDEQDDGQRPYGFDEEHDEGFVEMSL